MKSPLSDKSAAFADCILNLSDDLLVKKVPYGIEVCVKQCTRSGTSIGANIAEGVYAQSKEDLISKYSIAIKEASETKYWLDRLMHRNAIDKTIHDGMSNDLSEIIRMLSAAIRTLKDNILKEKLDKKKQ